MRLNTLLNSLTFYGITLVCTQPFFSKKKKARNIATQHFSNVDKESFVTGMLHFPFIGLHLANVGKEKINTFNKSAKSAVPKLGAARTCESCCIYCFSDKNCNVKVVSNFLQFYSVW